MRKLFIWLLIMVMIPLACQTLGDEQAEQQNGSEAAVVFINAGKADSTLLKIGGKVFLIDTGGPSSVPALLGTLSVMGVERINGLFLTHADSDHIGGTEALCQAYPVDRLYSATISKRNKNDENRIERLARVLGLSHDKLDAGDHIDIGGGTAFQVLAPLVYNDEDDNDNSLVLMIQIHGKRFLFTGDMKFAGEEVLLAEGTELAAHVLKVGYHGNPDATSLLFTQAVSAEYAVISTDTAEAPQSANERVIENLFPAQVLITERFSLGIRMDIPINGNLRITDLKPNPVTADLVITDIDTKTQAVTIINRGQTAELAGCFILSVRGNDIFIFPDGAVIQAGQTITVACLGGRGDYIWNVKNAWDKKNPDTGLLYDSSGNELSRR